MTNRGSGQSSTCLLLVSHPFSISSRRLWRLLHWSFPSRSQLPRPRLRSVTPAAGRVPVRCTPKRAQSRLLLSGPRSVAGGSGCECVAVPPLPPPPPRFFSRTSPSHRHPLATSCAPERSPPCCWSWIKVHTPRGSQARIGEGTGFGLAAAAAREMTFQNQGAAGEVSFLREEGAGGGATSLPGGMVATRLPCSGNRRNLREETRRASGARGKLARSRFPRERKRGLERGERG